MQKVQRKRSHVVQPIFHWPTENSSSYLQNFHVCHGQGCRVLLEMGDLPPFNRNPYSGYINPYYWVDDHPLLYGNNGSGLTLPHVTCITLVRPAKFGIVVLVSGVLPLGYGGLRDHFLVPSQPTKNQHKSMGGFFIGGFDHPNRRDGGRLWTQNEIFQQTMKASSSWAL